MRRGESNGGVSSSSSSPSPPLPRSSLLSSPTSLPSCYLDVDCADVQVFLLSDVNDSVVSSYGDIEGNSERLDPNRYQHVLVIRLPNLFLSDLSAVPFLFLSNSLRVLDLSGNQLQSVPDSEIWKCVGNLEVLFLHRNYLSSLKNIGELSVLRKLRVLTLYRNPVAMHPNYRQYVVNKIRSLYVFDDHSVADPETIDGLREDSPMFGCLGTRTTIPDWNPGNIAADLLSSSFDQRTTGISPVRLSAQIHRFLLSVGCCFSRGSAMRVVQSFIRGSVQRLRYKKELELRRTLYGSTMLIDEENSDVDVDDAGSTTDMFDELDIDLNVTKPEIVVLPRKPPLPTIERLRQQTAVRIQRWYRSIRFRRLAVREHLRVGQCFVFRGAFASRIESLCRRATRIMVGREDTETISSALSLNWMPVMETPILRRYTPTEHDEPNIEEKRSHVESRSRLSDHSLSYVSENGRSRKTPPYLSEGLKHTLSSSSDRYDPVDCGDSPVQVSTTQTESPCVTYFHEFMLPFRSPDMSLRSFRSRFQYRHYKSNSVSSASKNQSSNEFATSYGLLYRLPQHSLSPEEILSRLQLRRQGRPSAESMSAYGEQSSCRKIAENDVKDRLWERYIPQPVSKAGPFHIPAIDFQDRMVLTARVSQPNLSQESMPNDLNGGSPSFPMLRRRFYASVAEKQFVWRAAVENSRWVRSCIEASVSGQVLRLTVRNPHIVSYVFDTLMQTGEIREAFVGDENYVVESTAASTIQRVFRGHLVRRKIYPSLWQSVVIQRAAICIQRQWRGLVGRFRMHVLGHCKDLLSYVISDRTVFLPLVAFQRIFNLDSGGWIHSNRNTYVSERMLTKTFFSVSGVASTSNSSGFHDSTSGTDSSPGPIHPLFPEQAILSCFGYRQRSGSEENKIPSEELVSLLCPPGCFDRLPYWMKAIVKEYSPSSEDTDWFFWKKKKFISPLRWGSRVELISSDCVLRACSHDTVLRTYVEYTGGLQPYVMFEYDSSTSIWIRNLILGLIVHRPFDSLLFYMIPSRALHRELSAVKIQRVVRKFLMELRGRRVALRGKPSGDLSCLSSAIGTMREKLGYGSTPIEREADRPANEIREVRSVATNQLSLDNLPPVATHDSVDLSMLYRLEMPSLKKGIRKHSPSRTRVNLSSSRFSVPSSEKSRSSVNDFLQLIPQFGSSEDVHENSFTTDSDAQLAKNRVFASLTSSLPVMRSDTLSPRNRTMTRLSPRSKTQVHERFQSSEVEYELLETVSDSLNRRGNLESADDLSAGDSDEFVILGNPVIRQDSMLARHEKRAIQSAIIAAQKEEENALLKHARIEREIEIARRKEQVKEMRQRQRHIKEFHRSLRNLSLQQAIKQMREEHESRKIVSDIWRQIQNMDDTETRKISEHLRRMNCRRQNEEREQRKVEEARLLREEIQRKLERARDQDREKKEAAAEEAKQVAKAKRAVDRSVMAALEFVRQQNMLARHSLSGELARRRKAEEQRLRETVLRRKLESQERREQLDMMRRNEFEKRRRAVTVSNHLRKQLLDKKKEEDDDFSRSVSERHKEEKSIHRQRLISMGRAASLPSPTTRHSANPVLRQQDVKLDLDIAEALLPKTFKSKEPINDVVGDRKAIGHHSSHHEHRTSKPSLHAISLNPDRQSMPHAPLPEDDSFETLLPKFDEEGKESNLEYLKSKILSQNTQELKSSANSIHASLKNVSQNVRRTLRTSIDTQTDTSNSSIIEIDSVSPSALPLPPHPSFSSSLSGVRGSKGASHVELVERRTRVSRRFVDVGSQKQNSSPRVQTPSSPRSANPSNIESRKLEDFSVGGHSISHLRAKTAPISAVRSLEDSQLSCLDDLDPSVSPSARPRLPLSKLNSSIIDSPRSHRRSLQTPGRFDELTASLADSLTSRSIHDMSD